MNNNLINSDYLSFLDNLKKRVAASRCKAALSVNKELILLYHNIGTEILRSQEVHGWGAKIIEQLSQDLKVAFPESKGFGTRNLKYMRKFAQEYTEPEFVQQVVAQLPWGHILYLIDSVSDREIRNFYITQTVEHGWSRSVILLQVETNLHKRKGTAISNFKDKLPPPQSDLAHNTLKDPYIFDFLNVGNEAHEREIEKALIEHMEKFLLDMTKPIGLAEYRLTEALPDQIKTNLPTIEQLEAELSKDFSTI